jgi:8-oxo-dGTP diphosphatase
MIDNKPDRWAIYQLFASLVPCDSREKEQIDFARNWISSGAELYRMGKPDHPKIHLVSYFAVVDPICREFLLVDHKKAGLWLPPGGHVEPGEHPQETVRREAQEELGIQSEFLFQEPIFLTVTNTVGNVAPHTDVSLWYVLKGKKSDHMQFDREEFHHIRWFGANDIPFERSDPQMKRFIEKVSKMTYQGLYDNR